jgi:hypothetical protein
MSLGITHHFFTGCGILLGIFCSAPILCFVSARSTEIAIAFLKQFLLVALAPKQAPDRNGAEIINKKYFFRFRISVSLVPGPLG